jgi:hypothetical protein
MSKELINSKEIYGAIESKNETFSSLSRKYNTSHTTIRRMYLKEVEKQQKEKKERITKISSENKNPKKRPIEDELILIEHRLQAKLKYLEYKREYDTNKIIRMTEIYRDRYKNKNIFITKRLLRTLNRDEKSVRSALFFNK